MAAEAKEFRGWAVFNKRDEVMYWTVDSVKQGSIRTFVECDQRLSWRWWYGKGFRCRRVVVRPLTKGE